MELDQQSPIPKKRTRRKPNTDTWKSAEREIAKLLGQLMGDAAERVPVTGRAMGSAPDIKHPWFGLEAKHGKTAVTAKIKQAMKQAEAAVKFAREKQSLDQIPVVVLHPHGAKYTDTLVVIKITDLPRIRDYGRPPLERQAVHPDYPSDPADLHRPD